MLRPVLPSEIPRIAEFLDRETLVNRWLVAFFRHFLEMPPESAPYWGFWTESLESGTASPTGYSALVAHHFRNATTYSVLDRGFDPAELEVLLRDELLPERLIVDGPVLPEREKLAPAIFARAVGKEELVVFGLSPGEADLHRHPAAGFRPAVDADEPILRDFERLYARELGEEETETDLSALIARELAFVIEDAGQVAGTIRSNLSDGRYVHVGGLFIHPRFRGRGLGAMLLSGLCDQIHRGGSGAILSASRTNHPAVSVYRTVGFREIGTGTLLRFTEDAWRSGG